MPRRTESSWERQPGESTQAYEAFDTYIKMGSERSLRKVAKQLTKSEALIKRWSTKWKWPDRSREYDNDVKRQEFTEAQKEYRAMQKRQTQMAMLLQKKAAEALSKLDVDNLSAREILSFISEGVKIEAATRATTVEAAASETTAKPNNIFDALLKGTQEDIDTDDIPELQ